MVKAYPETTILKNVIGVRISERDAIISYLESPDDPVRDQETHMVRNPNGIVFNIQPGSSRFDEVAVKQTSCVNSAPQYGAKKLH